MRTYTLTEFASAPFAIIDGDRGRNYPKQNELSESGYCLFLNAGNVTRTGFAFERCQFITEEKDNALRKGKLRRNDVVLTTRGTIGNTAFFSSSVPYEHMRINSGMVILRCDEKRLLPAYLYHFLRSSQFLGQVNSLTSGVAQPQLPIRDMKRISMPLPSLSVQRATADVLSSYDNLIENNRRRIQLLEEAARLLYKEWFVHLRFPGHERATITDGVPKGWEKRQVKDILGKVKRTRTIKQADYLDEGSIPCVDQSRDFIGGYTDDEEAVINEGKPIIVFGDHTRILKFIDFPFARGADGTQLIVSNDSAITQEYLFFSLDAIDLSNYFYARHFKFLKDHYILRPKEQYIAQFTAHVRPMMQQIRMLRERNHRLAKAHDLLLPRLMNGEVVV